MRWSVGGAVDGCDVVEWGFVDESVHRAVDVRGDRAVVAALLAEQLPAGGRVVTDDPGLQEAFGALGLVLTRRSLPLTHRLAPPPSLALGPDDVVRPFGVEAAAELAPMLMAAYAPGSPDPFEGGLEEAETEIRICLEDPSNPVIPSCTAVLERAGAPAAVAIVWDSSAPLMSGPFVAHLFRDPAPSASGAGSALLAHVLRTVAGLGGEHVRLSVTEANTRARRAYERLGFEAGPAVWSFRLPGDGEG